MLINELNVDEFTYGYGIKALAHHEGFWYITKRGAAEKGVTGLHDNMGHWKDHFFFYSSEHPGEFRTVCK